MNLVAEFKRAFAVAKLDERTMKSLSKDRGATRMAFLFLLLSAVPGALGSILFPTTYDEVVYRPTFFEAILTAAESYVFALVVLFIVNWVAEIFLQGERTGFIPFFRVAGYGYVVGLLYLFPVLTLVGLVWFYVILGKSLMVVKKFSVFRAISSVVLAIVLIALVLTLFEFLNPGNLYGGLYVAPY